MCLALLALLQPARPLPQPVQAGRHLPPLAVALEGRPRAVEDGDQPLELPLGCLGAPQTLALQAQVPAGARACSGRLAVRELQPQGDVISVWRSPEVRCLPRCGHLPPSAALLLSAVARPAHVHAIPNSVHGVPPRPALTGEAPPVPPVLPARARLNCFLLQPIPACCTRQALTCPSACLPRALQVAPADAQQLAAVATAEAAPWFAFRIEQPAAVFRAGGSYTLQLDLLCSGPDGGSSVAHSSVGVTAACTTSEVCVHACLGIPAAAPHVPRSCSHADLHAGCLTSPLMLIAAGGAARRRAPLGRRCRCRRRRAAARRAPAVAGGAGHPRHA